MRRVVPIVVLGFVALAAAGCKNDDAPTAASAVADVELDSELYERELTACIRAEGIDVERRDGGSIFLVESDAFPRERQLEILQTCEAEMVDRGLALPPWVLSESGVKEGYDNYVQIAECLRGLGYSAPPTPSEEAVMENPALLPNPYQDLMATRRPDALESVIAECES